MSGLGQARPVERPKRRYPPRFLRSTASPPYASPAFTTAHHVRGVIEHLQRTEAALVNAFLNVRKAVDADLDQAIGNVRREMEDNDEELRDSLRYVLVGSIRDRVVGAVLFALGVVFSVAGSVIGALA